MCPPTSQNAPDVPSPLPLNSEAGGGTTAIHRAVLCRASPTPTHIPTLRTLPVKRSSRQRVAHMRPRRISEGLGHLPCGFTYKVAQLPPQTVFIAAFLLLALSSADCQAGSSLPVATLDVAATLLYDSARASAAARSPGAIAGFAFTASSSITAPFTVARFARSEFLPFVSICTARAANLYVSHNF